jgi:hypothetical protein
MGFLYLTAVLMLIAGMVVAVFMFSGTPGL